MTNALAEPRSATRPTEPTSAIVRTEPVWSGPISSGVLILATLALIAALYVGKEVVLPIALAVVLKLLLQPMLNFLCTKLHLPAALGALILICGLFVGVGAVAVTVSGPTSGWIEKVPQVLPTLKQKLVALRQPIEYMQNAFKEIEDVAAPAHKGEKAPIAVKEQSVLASNLAFATLAVMGRLASTMIVLFFLLAAGDRLLRGLIEVLPTFSDKRQAAEIASEIQRQIGGYLITISVMNLVVGAAAGFAMWACGLGDPILWGSFAFLLNYVPILGPLTGIGVFLIVGIVTLDGPFQALLPATCYTMIHITEGEIITPMLLAKRFTINPVFVIISLFFWHAMWGIPGALLAVPLLATFKIICDRVEPLKPVGHIMGA